MKINKLLLAFLVLNCSCGLFRPTYDHVYKIPSDFAAYFDYKVGSYWIYHNDSLNIDDTFKVIKREPRIEELNADTGYDILSITYYESYNKGQLDDYINYLTYCRSFLWKSPSDDSLTPHVDFGVGYNSQSGEIYADSIEKLVNYFSNNFTYNVVYKVKSLQAYDEDYYDENYIALRKGNVKTVRTINGKKIVWYLKKSKIIQ